MNLVIKPWRHGKSVGPRSGDRMFCRATLLGSVAVGLVLAGAAVGAQAQSLAKHRGPASLAIPALTAVETRAAFAPVGSASVRSVSEPPAATAALPAAPALEPAPIAPQPFNAAELAAAQSR